MCDSPVYPRLRRSAGVQKLHPPRRLFPVSCPPEDPIRHELNRTFHYRILQLIDQKRLSEIG